MDMAEILDTLTVGQPSTVKTQGTTKEKTLEELGEFHFLTSADKVGLPQEDKRYVKRSCKTCYGRGYVVQLIKSGRRDRHYQTCACVNKGYVRVRLELEKLAEKLSKDVTTDADGNEGTVGMAEGRKLALAQLGY
jgi:hypothetical protein